MNSLSLLARIYGPELANDPVMIVFIAGAAFVFGSVIGSFLNVCIARLPVMSLASQYRKGDDDLKEEIVQSLSDDPAAGRSMIEEMVRENVGIARPRSRCPSCKTAIAWYDNVPIASWLLLRAKCRHCAQPISPIYPAIEFMSGIALAYLILRFDLIVGPIYFAIYASMVVVTGVDLAIFEIPDEIVIPGMPLGLLATLVLPTTFADGVIGIAVGAGIPYLIGKIYYLFMKQEGMGLGDVKLLGMIGAFFGWRGVIAILLIASAVGSVIGISLVFLKNRHYRAKIPFGPFIALGALVYMLAGSQLLDYYARLTGH